MRLNKLSPKDRPLFDKFLRISRHDLAVYSFENIFIWKKLFSIEWALKRDHLCVFFRDKIGCFLYLAPLGKEIKAQVIDEIFRVMDKFNKNKEISRIENIEEKDTGLYRSLGLAVKEKSLDYLCLREDLAGLRTDKFKSKRASYNYFTKNYKSEYLCYRASHKNGCLKLYHLWMHQRMQGNRGELYQGMLLDSLRTFQVMLDDYRKLKLEGRAVRIGKEIKAFTFGYRLNDDTFCILYEITDLTIKGLAQFIFREFSRDLKGYTYINIMDDSGLENLKKVKLSYQPVKFVPAYIAKRKS